MALSIDIAMALSAEPEFPCGIEVMSWVHVVFCCFHSATYWQHNVPIFILQKYKINCT